MRRTVCVVFTILYIMLIFPVNSNRNKTERGRSGWKNRFYQLELKLDRAINYMDHIAALEKKSVTVTTSSPTNDPSQRSHLEETVQKLQESIETLTGKLNNLQLSNRSPAKRKRNLQTILVHKLTPQKNPIFNNISSKNVGRNDRENRMQRDGLPEVLNDGVTDVPIPLKEKGNATPVTTGSSIKKDGASTKTVEIEVPEIAQPIDYELLMGKLEQIENRLEHSHFQLNRKLMRIQHKIYVNDDASDVLPIPLPEINPPTTSPLATELQIKELQEQVQKVHHTVQIELKAVQHLLNLELGVALRAMQTDIQRCARLSSNMRHVVGKALTRSFDNSWEDMVQSDDPLPQLISSRRAQTANREAQLDHLGSVTAVELTEFKPKSCADVFQRGFSKSGVYTIWIHGPESTTLQMYAYCDMETDGGGWTVIQRRGNFGGVFENFTRPWADYKHGFGKVTQEFWFGNDAIHALAQQQQVKLRIELDDWSGNRTYAEYAIFHTASEKEAYKLTIGNYSGNMPDSFLYHNGGVFSTFDRNSGNYSSEWCVFLQGQKAGWWYKNCYMAKLNAPYKMQANVGRAEGIQWRMWKGYEYSFKGAEMKVRPLCFADKCIRSQA